jgi:peroxiredoxin
MLTLAAGGRPMATTATYGGGMRSVRTSILATVLAGLLAVAGCAGGGSGRGGQDGRGGPGAPAQPTPTASASSPTAPASSPGAPVPERLRFTGRTVDGRDFDGATLAGKPAVLWFWAPWCPTCMRQSGAVRDTAAKYAGKVNVVGIAGQDDLSAMKGFVKEQNVGSVPHVADEPGTVWKRFGVTAQSTYVLLDASGTVTHKGYLDANGLATRVAALAG